MGRIYSFSLHSHIFLICCSHTSPQPPFHQTKQSQCLQQAFGSCFHIPPVHSAVGPHLSAIFVPAVGHNFSLKFYQHCIEDLENFKSIPNKKPIYATQHEVYLFFFFSPPQKYLIIVAFSLWFIFPNLFCPTTSHPRIPYLYLHSWDISMQLICKDSIPPSLPQWLM